MQLPNSTATEAAVLGAIINDHRCLDDLRTILHTPLCFYEPAYAAMYEAILYIKDTGGLVDVITLVEQLGKNDKLHICGGPHAVAHLSSSVTSAAHVHHHALIVREKYIAREIVDICTRGITTAYEGKEDVLGQLDVLNKELTAIMQNTRVKEPAHIATTVQRALEKMQQQKNSNELYTGVPTGFAQLDAVTGGWQAGDMIVVSAEAGTGKTALALNLACNAASHPRKTVPALFFNLEMGETPLTQRLQAAVCQVPLSHIRNPKCLDADEEARLVAQSGHIARLPLYIDTPASLTMLEFKAKVRRAVTKNNIGLVVVDYLQCIVPAGKAKDTREQEVSRISRELKATAKELDIPIIVLSSLNRAGQTRDSGNIDFDADIKITLHKPTDADIQANPNLHNCLMADITKHRNGETAAIPLLFKKDVQRFE
jgi:replicative DNA helicase